jgi:hypothetical protein
VADGTCFSVNGRTPAKVLRHWISIVARNVVAWSSMTTILACLKVDRVGAAYNWPKLK